MNSTSQGSFLALSYLGLNPEGPTLSDLVDAVNLLVRMVVAFNMAVRPCVMTRVREDR